MWSPSSPFNCLIWLRVDSPSRAHHPGVFGGSGRLSSDRVVADPELNRRFLERARQLGAEGTDFQLNWTLFNARKAGIISLPTKTRRYTIAGKDEFEFATEMAISFIQRKLERELGRAVSLDKIICDPELADQFDKTAVLLAPDTVPLNIDGLCLACEKLADSRRKRRKLRAPDSRIGVQQQASGQASCRLDRGYILCGRIAQQSTLAKPISCGIVLSITSNRATVSHCFLSGFSRRGKVMFVLEFFLSAQM